MTHPGFTATVLHNGRTVATRTGKTFAATDGLYNWAAEKLAAVSGSTVCPGTAFIGGRHKITARIESDDEFVAWVD